MRVLAVIPARLASERLPRKPLQLLGGRPLIQWVWERAASFTSVHAAVIATDSDEIAVVAASFGARVVLTSESHRSGTERAAEVIGMTGYSDYDVVVNIQGDEPFIAEEHVTAAVAEVLAGKDIGTVATAVGTRDAWLDPSVVKVVRDNDGGALYFSRAPIPHVRGSDPDDAALASGEYLRHIGIYAYTRAALLAWVALPETALERTEKLEQLRPLAAGMTIGVAIVGEAIGGIDTHEDLARAERIIAERSAAPTSPRTR